jgi:DNA-binding PadR family transcriptional regulator
MARTKNSSRQTESVLQALIASGDAWRHGYDMSRETGLKSGTLYPILMRLERQGWLEAVWEDEPTPGRPRRHLYRLTALGRTEAAAALRAAALRAGAPSRKPASTTSVAEGGVP